LRIAIGSDHRGVALRGELASRLREEGHEILDCGCDGPEPCDYPDPAVAVAEAVAASRCDRGILLCGSGIGVSIAANKVPGVRAARCCTLADALASRRHNDANVICLGADALASGPALELVRAWLAEAFEGGRHARRLDKIRAYEAARGAAPAARDTRGAEGKGSHER